MTQLDYFIISLLLTFVTTYICFGSSLAYQRLTSHYGKKHVYLLLQKVAFFALPFIGVVVLVVSML